MNASEVFRISEVQKIVLMVESCDNRFSHLVKVSKGFVCVTTIIRNDHSCVVCGHFWPLQ